MTLQLCKEQRNLNEVEEMASRAKIKGFCLQTEFQGGHTTDRQF